MFTRVAICYVLEPHEEAQGFTVGTADICGTPQRAFSAAPGPLPCPLQVGCTLSLPDPSAIRYGPCQVKGVQAGVEGVLELASATHFGKGLLP